MSILHHTTDVAFAHGSATGSRYPQTGYEDDVTRQFVVASMFWAIVAFLMGVLIATQLVIPGLYLGEYTSFGRLRAVHTSAAVVAFGGNVLMGCSFYIVQRTCRTRLFGGKTLAQIVFWGFQLVILLAASGYVLGISQGKEYAEPEWYTDILLTLVWVLYAVAFFGTVATRKEPHIYVANWFFMAFIVTVAMLHITNNIAVPVSWTGAKSYGFYSGAQDAMIQWWYGHNMVGFFLTAAFIGLMYYFVPKQAERPVYSYRLSIVHFWALIFLYIWAGPHHLLYTALPDWTQTLGMVFSVMLWMPSWGGMINGIMTLSGAWEKLRTDPIIRFLVVAVAFYGMSTFEGPLLAVKAVNSLGHYTDWIVGHVHSGALGWVAFMSFGAMYYLIPRLWGKSGLYSIKLVEWHFWLASIGIILYITALWISGMTQGLMWRAYTELGFLQYSFVDQVVAVKPYHAVRALGGLIFLSGALIMAYNFYRTVKMPAQSATANIPGAQHA